MLHTIRNFFGITFCILYVNIASAQDDKLKVFCDSIVDFKNPLFYLKNISEDTIIFPVRYSQRDVVFKDSSLFRIRIISSTAAYPASNFKKLKKKEKKYVLQNFCLPYVSSKDFAIIYPNDSISLPVYFREEDYRGFTSNNLYKGALTIYVSDVITSFCPRIWHGSLKLNFVTAYQN